MTPNSIADQYRQIHALENELYATPAQHAMLDLAMAVASSVEVSIVNGWPVVWLMFSGPPSCGKTSTVELLRGCQSKVIFRDQITAAGLKSDYVNPQSGKTPRGLLYGLDKHCLVIKEMAALFSLHPNALKTFIGTLQAAYDGQFDSQSGTVGHQAIKTTFAFLGCGTPDVFEQHLHAMNAIGPRFLYYRIPQLTLTEMRELARQRKAIKDLHRKMTALGAMVASHLEQLPAPEESEPWPDEIDRLAEFLVQGRCTPQYLKDEDDGYKKQVVGVTIEDPTRLTKQLYTLGLCLARLRGEREIADQDVGLLMQVVMSTLPYARWKVLEAIAEEEDEEKDGGESETAALTKEEFFKQRIKGTLGDRAGIPDSEASRINDILRRTELLHRPGKHWRIRPEYLEMIKRGRIVFDSKGLA
jgi:hypothetical protein